MRLPHNYILAIRDVGLYESDTFVGLLFEIVKHRFEHWRRGEGWVD